MIETFVVVRLLGIHKMYLFEILGTLDCVWVDDATLANHYTHEENAVDVADVFNHRDMNFTITIERYVS